jgi:hypothetical protein
MPGRNPRQCRERWQHYLNPTVSSKPFTAEEDALLNRKFAEFGPRWKQIAACLEGRTDITIKNRWILLSRRQHRAVATFEDITPVCPRPAPVLTLPIFHRPQERSTPVQLQEDIPWSSEEEDDRTTLDGSAADVTGDYFCLNFARWE